MNYGRTMRLAWRHLCLTRALDRAIFEYLDSRRWAKVAALGAALCLPAIAVGQSYEVLHTFTLDGANPASPLIQATGGNFYGTTSLGGANNYGAIYRTDSSGNLTTIYSFTGGADGANPIGGLLEASDGTFYGSTNGGGANSLGTTFKIDSAGNLTTLHSFAGSDGAGPTAALIQAADGDLYGTTFDGGSGDNGTVFRMDLAGSVTPLHSFAGSDGANPQGGLFQAADGEFYGTTAFGGAGDFGTVFKMNSSGNLTTLHSFAGSDGAYPAAGLILGTDGNLYGTTFGGGAEGYGTIFMVDSSGDLTTLRSLEVLDGTNPFAGLIQAADGSFYGTTERFGGGHGTVFKIDAAGNLTVLHTFLGNDGANPSAGLIQAADGDFYGTTYTFGFNYGTVFKIDSSGSLTTLHVFGYSDGALRYAGVIQASDGSLYGTAYWGGSENVGTVFRIDPSGNLATLHTFANIQTPSNGSYPIPGLTQGTDGNFYGTTIGGGANNSGIAFKVDAAGNFTVLHSFAGYPNDGGNPFGGLVQATDGSLYGTTANGGVNGVGAVFRIDPSGSETVLHSFADYPSEGASPHGTLIQGSDGAFYGTTSGGANGFGSVYRIDAAGNFTTLHAFVGSDGASPNAALIQATDGDLYGTTAAGGAKGYGTIFKMDLSGNLITLHTFAISDGATPQGSLVQGADGNFYGTTASGGANFAGTIFRMDSAGNLSVLHSFEGSDGLGPYAGPIQGSDGAFYGTAQGGPGTGAGVVYRLAACSPAPVPSISATVCLPANTSGFVASVPGVSGDTYIWTLVGGAIDSGQGTNTISLTSGGPGTLMSLNVVETNSSNCSGGAFENLQVDFADEPPSDPFYPFVCTIGRNRITSGCGGGDYCPAAPVTRAQAAVFLLKAEHGSSYLPPSCTGIFVDVPCPSPFADWIERLYAEGITAGCGGGNFCPGDAVTRAQIAVLILRAKHGSTYMPPNCMGLFEDASCPTDFAVNWIEQVNTEQISAGCSMNPPKYCPTAASTRGQLAVFLVKAFNLE